MKKITTLLSAAGLALAFGAANASVIDPNVDYTLNNHPNGSAASPFYGLRLDGLLSGNSNHIYTFDFEAAGSAMSMTWDDTADTIVISGSSQGGQDGGSSYVSGTTALWDITFTYSGITACGTGLCASIGTGQLSSDLGDFDLVAVSGSHSYAFQLNTGHRGFSGISGWGWMNHCPSAGSTSTSSASCDTHLYASDWLFTAERKEVPAPATLLLLGLGLIGLGARRRVMR